MSTGTQDELFFGFQYPNDQVLDKKVIEPLQQELPAVEVKRNADQELGTSLVMTLQDEWLQDYMKFLIRKKLELHSVMYHKLNRLEPSFIENCRKG